MEKNMEEKIREILSLIFSVDKSQIKSESTSENFENWDSLNHMKLITKLEEEFDVEIDEDDMLDLTSYEAILKYFKKNKL